MRARDRSRFKKTLEEKRANLIAVVQKTESYGREAVADGETMDIADQATSSYTKEFMFRKSNGDRQLLQAVVEALNRIEDKTYGECSNCGEPVEPKRLQAVPWTALCLACQEQAESMGL